MARSDVSMWRAKYRALAARNMSRISKQNIAPRGYGISANARQHAEYHGMHQISASSMAANMA